MRVAYPLICWAFWLGSLACGASSCALYQPLLPTLPALRGRGDVAGTATWQVPYGVQASGAGSPVAHGLLFATGALHFYNAQRDSSNNYARNRQFEAGFGGYATVHGVWLSAAVGAGQGRGYRFGRFEPFSLIGGGAVIPVPGGSSGVRARIPELLGYYNTRFTQVSAWWLSARAPHSLRWGARLRYAQVRFTELKLNGINQLLPVQPILQSTIIAQYQWHRLSWQASATYAVSLGTPTNEAAFAPAPLRLGAGVGFCPFKKPAAAPGPSTTQ